MVSAARKLDRPATMADLETLPAGVKGEIIEGVLYTQPRPRRRHSRASARLYAHLGGPFENDPSGPGGWVILIEPGIELPESPEVAPDLAGWHTERLAGHNPDEAITVIPDWVCEVFSPGNRAYDIKVKFPFYARVGVSWLWVVDPPSRTLEVKRLQDGRWVDHAAFAEEDHVRAEPFAAIEFHLATLWLP